MMPVDGDSSAATQLQLGLEALRLGGAQPFEVVDAVGARRRLDLLDPGDLGLLGRDDQLAEPRVRHAVLGAIGVEALAAGDAGRRLQAALRVVEPAVDDLAVARGGLEADRVGAFEDDDLVPGQRQRPRRRQPDDPGADHHRFDLVHRWVHRPASQDWEQAGHLGRNLFPRKGARPGRGNSLIAGNSSLAAGAMPIPRVGNRGCRVRPRAGQGRETRRTGSEAGRTRKMQGNARRCRSCLHLRPLRTDPATGLRQFCRRSADAGHPTIFAGIIRCAAANGPCLTHSECRTWPETDFPKAPRRCQSRH